MNSEYNTKPKNRGGLAFVSVIIMMVICVAAAVGLFAAFSNNTPDDERDIESVRSEIDEKSE